MTYTNKNTAAKRTYGVALQRRFTHLSCCTSGRIMRRLPRGMAAADVVDTAADVVGRAADVIAGVVSGVEGAA